MTKQDEAPKPAGGTPVERPVRPGLVALVRKLELDHGPGGWPPVEMATLSALADEVERLTCQVVALEYSEGRAVAAERERWSADARLAAYVRERVEESSDGWRIDVWINGAPSMETIDDVLRA